MSKQNQYVLFELESRTFHGSAGPMFFESVADAEQQAKRLRAREGLRAVPKGYATVAVPAP